MAESEAVAELIEQRKQATSPEQQLRKKVIGHLSDKEFATAIQATAEHFTTTEYMLTFQDTDETYLYRAGVYVSDGQKIISAKIEALLRGFCNTRFVNELLNKLRRMTYAARKDCSEPLMKICLANGLLNLETMLIELHSPQEYFFNKLPVTYDATADCPLIKKFISEIVPADTVPVLQEVIGYCLYKSYPIHKAVMLVGVGANGKSTFIGLVKLFLGPENCASVPLQQLEINRFAASALHGKLANLYADLPASALRETSHFKMLTGQDLIDAERKFKDKFSFLNYSKQIFSANKVPQSPDDSDAFFRRWVIITFPNQFIDNADRSLLQKLATPGELAGLLNWAIEGLKRLLVQGDFSNARSIQEVRETYIRMSDSVAAFAMDCILVSSDDYVQKKELYTVYTDYCRARNYPAAAENTFHRDLQRQVRVEDYRPKLDGQRVQCWKGIRLGNDSVELKMGKKADIPDRVDTESDKNVPNAQNVRAVNDVKAFPNLSASKRLHSIFFELVASTRDGLAPREKLDSTAAINGISQSEVDTWVEKAKSSGDIYEKRPGFLALVNGEPVQEVPEEAIEDA